MFRIIAQITALFSTLCLLGTPNVSQAQGIQGEYLIRTRVHNPDIVVPRLVHLTISADSTKVAIVPYFSPDYDLCEQTNWCRIYWDGLTLDTRIEGKTFHIDGQTNTADDYPSDWRVRGGPFDEQIFVIGPILFALNNTQLSVHADGTLEFSGGLESIIAYPLTQTDLFRVRSIPLIFETSASLMNNCHVQSYWEHVVASGGQSKFLSALDYAVYIQDLYDAEQQQPRPDYDALSEAEQDELRRSQGAQRVATLASNVSMLRTIPVDEITHAAITDFLFEIIGPSSKLSREDVADIVNARGDGVLHLNEYQTRIGEFVTTTFENGGDDSDIRAAICADITLGLGTE
ncbi:hypothetical protein [Aestuariibius sp. HNIBRBA575]|uniref:hypothetical protein n=1 Tax=Aestuariibius sp. HNIBRBA575 TaxID=3233343 RepID=UPI0034A130F0